MIELTTSIKSKHTSKGVQYQYFINDVKVRTSFRIYSNACAVVRDDVFAGILCCGNFKTCQSAYIERMSVIQRHKKNGGYYANDELAVVNFPNIEA